MSFSKRIPDLVQVCSLALLVAAVLGCSSFTPISIGFVGQLTGKFSDLGVGGRNGARLAIETANDEGGINGRPIRLHSRDDGNMAATAIQAINELTEVGCVAVIGPMTSAMALAVAGNTPVILVSPTTATPTLKDMDDLFFRVMPVSTDWAVSLAGYALTHTNIRTVLILGDQDNADYVNTFNEAFASSFTKRGGQIIDTLQYSSNALRGWQDILSTIERTAPDALLMSASARDVAELARRMRSRNISLPILCPSWPYTQEIIQAGGKAVEGIIFCTSYVVGNTLPAFLKFKTAFTERFGYDPGFPEAFGYEAATALITALRASKSDPQKLKGALLQSGPSNGVIGTFEFNRFGDVKRDNFISTIRNGEFVLVGTES